MITPDSSAGKRILLIAPQVPWPPRQGTAIRNLNLVLELAKRHSVTLAAFEEQGEYSVGADASVDDDVMPDPLAAAGVTLITAPAPAPRSILTRLIDLPTRATPDLARRLTSTPLDARLADLVEASARNPESAGFDVVQIEGLEMAPHGLAVHRQLAQIAANAEHDGAEHVGTAVSAKAPRLIYDAHNAEWVLQDRAWRADSRRIRRWPGAAYSMVQTVKLKAYERALLRAADATVAVSDADAEALRPLAPNADIIVVPNGVDVDHYRVTDASQEVDGVCVFTGKMDFRPNVDAMTWFCREVWPEVRAARSDARLEIVGRNPVPRITALHDDGAGILVAGAVPDVRPYVDHASVIVVPLRVGGGTRLKVLEAMSMGKAMAATTLAVEGLDVRDGHEASLADSPEDLARAIVSLLGNPEKRRALGATARQRAEQKYRWAALVPSIERLYG